MPQNSLVWKVVLKKGDSDLYQSVLAPFEWTCYYRVGVPSMGPFGSCLFCFGYNDLREAVNFADWAEMTSSFTSHLLLCLGQGVSPTSDKIPSTSSPKHCGWRKFWETLETIPGWSFRPSPGTVFAEVVTPIAEVSWKELSVFFDQNPSGDPR